MIIYVQAERKGKLVFTMPRRSRKCGRQSEFRGDT